MVGTLCLHTKPVPDQEERHLEPRETRIPSCGYDCHVSDCFVENIKEWAHHVGNVVIVKIDASFDSSVADTRRVSCRGRIRGPLHAGDRSSDCVSDCPMTTLVLTCWRTCMVAGSLLTYSDHAA